MAQDESQNPIDALPVQEDGSTEASHLAADVAHHLIAALGRHLPAATTTPGKYIQSVVETSYSQCPSTPAGCETLGTRGARSAVGTGGACSLCAGPPGAGGQAGLAARQRPVGSPRQSREGCGPVKRWVRQQNLC